MATLGWTVEAYRSESGETPVRTFMDSLAGRHRDEAAALMAALREHGNQLRPPRSKLVGDGLFELRGHQVRIFYVFRPGRRIVLLDGMIKKRDDIPRDVLKRLRQMQKRLEESGDVP